jgi:DNA-directed RNA polymerase subunit M/transcription elongation factor TFIIS
MRDDGEAWKGDSQKWPSFSYLFGEPLTDEQRQAQKDKAEAEAMLAELAYPTLPMYRADELCAKCGSHRARLAYCDIGRYPQRFGKTGSGLLVTCKRCGHSWARRPLDGGPT